MGGVFALPLKAEAPQMRGILSHENVHIRTLERQSEAVGRIRPPYDASDPIPETGAKQDKCRWFRFGNRDGSQRVIALTADGFKKNLRHVVAGERGDDEAATVGPSAAVEHCGRSDFSKRFN